MNKERENDRMQIEGPQGVDQDPEQDPAIGMSQPIKDSQKAKGKVDGDPDQSKDRPAENDRQS